MRHQDDFIDLGRQTLTKIDEYVQGCTAVVHVVGPNFGSVAPPPSVDGLFHQHGGNLHFTGGFGALGEEVCSPEKRYTFSYTQWEAYLAAYYKIPLLIYRPKHPPQSQWDPRQLEHLARLQQAELFATEYESDAELENLILKSVLKQLLDRFPEQAQQLRQQLKPVSLPYPSIGALFKGREDFLRELRESLHKSLNGRATAIVGKAVHGLGGVGKTRLAVEYAWQHAGDYSAVLFVVADSPANLKKNLADLAGPLVLNLPEQQATEEEAKVAAALRWLNEHPGWFLILDNVDDDASAAAAEDLLAKLHGGQVLITSRLTRWRGGVEPLELDVLDETSAAQFLLDSTTSRQRTPTDQADAAALARELAGLALALEQAAAYIDRRRISLAEYLRSWRAHDQKVQQWYDPRLMKYPRSVAVTWQTTLDKLGPGEIALLRLFAWFAPEPIPLWVVEGNAAEGIWREGVKLAAEEFPERIAPTDDLRASLATLADYSMVKWLADENVLLVHRVVQETLRGQIPDATRKDWATLSLRMLDKVAPEKPTDVRTWSRWNPLRAHVASASTFADELETAAPTSCLMSQLGLLLDAKALDAQAEPLLRRALALDEQSFGPDHHEVAVRLNCLARVLSHTNRFSEAEPLLRRALAIHEASKGPDDPKVALLLNNLAQLLADTDRCMEAEPLMRRALAIDEKWHGSDHHEVARDLNNLASLLVATNRCTEAEPLMRQGLAIFEKEYGEDHPNVAIALNNLWRLLVEMKRHREAEPLIRRAVEIDEKWYGPNHPTLAVCLSNLASLLRDTERVFEAEPLMHRVVTIFHEFGQSTGHEHPHMQTALRNYGILLAAMGLAEPEIAERLREFEK